MLVTPDNLNTRLQGAHVQIDEQRGLVENRACAHTIEQGPCNRIDEQ